MSSVSERLAKAGYTVPPTPAAAGEYVPAVRVGALVFTSGQLPMRDGALITTGTVDDIVTGDVASECASQCALNAIAAASTVCDIDEIVSVVKVVGYVASRPGFSAQPSVINGASALMHTAFGDAGRHAREAVGVAALPLGAPVEVSIIFALSECE